MSPSRTQKMIAQYTNTRSNRKSVSEIKSTFRISGTDFYRVLNNNGLYYRPTVATPSASR